MKLSNLKVWARLALGFATVLALMLVLAFNGVVRMATMQDRLTQIVSTGNVKVALVNDLRQSVMNAIINGRNIALMTDQAEIDAENRRLADNRAVYKKLNDKLASMIRTDAEKADLEKIADTRAASVAVVTKMTTLLQAGEREQSNHVLLNELQPLQTMTIVAMDDMVRDLEKEVAQAADEATQAHLAARQQTLVLTLAALLLGAGMAWLIAKSLTRQLGGEPSYAAAIAERIAEGELDVQVLTHQDDKDSLLAAIETMRARLAQLVGQVRSATDNITHASNEIASGNASLSARTEAQAGSLEETAATMEELTSTVKQNAEHAQHANALARKATSVAERGGEVVAEVVATMGSINESSKQIVDIISVIDSIAFQTNILALNAAVEAARAGEQGRGFAVVASEVRNLAHRSAGAAKEIKQLINDSVSKVDAGSRLVNDAGMTMGEIVDSIRTVTGIMGEISAATTEQTHGIEQANVAIMEMDGVTQQNAALVEEAAAAAQAMQHQADALSRLVSVFKIGSAGADGSLHANAVKPLEVANLQSAPSALRTLASRNVNR